MKIKAELSIVRDSRDKIRIYVTDEASHKQFLAMEMSPADFTMAVTGLSGVRVDADVRDTAVLGKVKVTEHRTIECALDGYDRANLEAWLAQNGKEEGWIVNPYLGSQGSVGHNSANGTRVLRYTVHKYVDA